MRLISHTDLFQIRVAASLWLAEHKDDPNAASVKTALVNTNEPERQGESK